METSVKQRLKEYIKYNGIPVRLFESTCGLSYGYVSNMRVSTELVAFCLNHASAHRITELYTSMRKTHIPLGSE